jgi:hypothetical protein
VVRQKSAKLLCVGSIPTSASNLTRAARERCAGFFFSDADGHDGVDTIRGYHFGFGDGGACREKGANDATGWRSSSNRQADTPAINSKRGEEGLER